LADVCETDISTAVHVRMAQGGTEHATCMTALHLQRVSEKKVTHDVCHIFYRFRLILIRFIVLCRE